MALASRLSIRVKITLAFLVAMSIVLGATGAFLYLRFQTNLDQAINRGLRSQIDAVRVLIAQSDSGLQQGARGLARHGQSFAQVVRNGRVIDFTPSVGRRGLLDRMQLARAAASPLIVERYPLRSGGGPARLLAAPVSGQDGQREIVVAGTSLGERDRALSDLAALLALGGAGALGLAAIVGYVLTAAALRMVERMRRHAETISVAAPGARLPVPRARDELWRLGTTLNEMLARNEATFARERTFVADASHELRTPLTILRAELEIALRGSGSTEELRYALSSAVEETDRLVRLSEDLLIIARAEQGELRVDTRCLVVEDLLRRVEARFREYLHAARRSVAVRVTPGLRLSADPDRLEQALGNMLDNALRHGEGPIVLSACRAADTVELHVADEGDGFPREFIADAFERFARADAARSSEGTGLGLAIVRGIARAHGGDAHVANGAAGGADVWLTLPAGLLAGPPEIPALPRAARLSGR